MKMAIKQVSGDWRMVSDRHCRDEAHFQKLLYENPELIPIEDLGEDARASKVVIREAGLPGSGNTDLIALDEAGGITVIECKLATNPEVKRKVIGQVLEYAAYLWRMPYEELDAIARRREGKSLIELMSAALDEETKARWAADDFRTAIAESLQSGSFRLIIAVDSLNDELRRTVEYLNSAGPTALSIFVLEVMYFADKMSEFLIPQLHGIVGRKPSQTGSERSKWDAERFMRDAEAKNDHVSIERIVGLLAFAREFADRIYWGTGKATGSFTFHYLLNEKTVSVFSVYSNGTLTINFGWSSSVVPESVLQQFVEQLRPIGGLGKLKAEFNKWPNFKVARALPKEADLESFREAIRWLGEQVRILENQSNADEELQYSL